MINKKGLITLANIEYTLRHDMLNLYNEYLDLLNITSEERQRIEDAIITTIDKLDNIRSSNIRDLDDHVEVDLINRISE